MIQSVEPERVRLGLSFGDFAGQTGTVLTHLPVRSDSGRMSYRVALDYPVRGRDEDGEPYVIDEITVFENEIDAWLGSGLQFKIQIERKIRRRIRILDRLCRESMEAEIKRWKEKRRKVRKHRAVFRRKKRGLA